MAIHIPYFSWGAIWSYQEFPKHILDKPSPENSPNSFIDIFINYRKTMANQQHIGGSPRGKSD